MGEVAIVKPTMTMKQINLIFRNNKEILLKKGLYNISAPIIVNKNTEVTCEEGVKLYKKCNPAMLQLRCMKCNIDYGGVRNVTWKGGKFIGMTNLTNSNLVEMCHARNIVFEDAEFISCRGLHFFEINGSRDVTIRRCSFGNHITQINKEHKEAIQLDFANIDGFPYGEPTSPMYDGTHCKNIIVEDCTFDDCLVCVGTHTVTTLPKEAHTNIIIRNNVATGRKRGSFVKLLNMKNVEIYGNKIKDFEDGIYYERMKTGHEASGGKKELEGYKVNQDIKCRENEFINVENWFYAR